MNDTAALRREVELLRTKVIALESDQRVMQSDQSHYGERLNYIEKWMSKQANRD